jgi:hypothetical protein
MVCRVPGCLGNYDFDEIVSFARKRFVEGCDTVTLMQQAETQCEKEEIALVSLLSVEDDHIRDLQLSCRHKGECTVMDCRDRLKRMLSKKLGTD